MSDKVAPEKWHRVEALFIWRDLDLCKCFIVNRGTISFGTRIIFRENVFEFKAKRKRQNIENFGEAL